MIPASQVYKTELGDHEPPSELAASHPAPVHELAQPTPIHEMEQQPNMWAQPAPADGLGQQQQQPAGPQWSGR